MRNRSFAGLVVLPLRTLATLLLVLTALLVADAPVEARGRGGGSFGGFGKSGGGSIFGGGRSFTAPRSSSMPTGTQRMMSPRHNAKPVMHNHKTRAHEVRDKKSGNGKTVGDSKKIDKPAALKAKSSAPFAGCTGLACGGSSSPVKSPPYRRVGRGAPVWLLGTIGVNLLLADVVFNLDTVPVPVVDPALTRPSKKKVACGGLSDKFPSRAWNYGPGSKERLQSFARIEPLNPKSPADYTCKDILLTEDLWLAKFHDADAQPVDDNDPRAPPNKKVMTYAFWTKLDPGMGDKLANLMRVSGVLTFDHNLRDILALKQIWPSSGGPGGAPQSRYNAYTIACFPAGTLIRNFCEGKVGPQTETHKPADMVVQGGVDPRVLLTNTETYAGGAHQGLFIGEFDQDKSAVKATFNILEEKTAEAPPALFGREN